MSQKGVGLVLVMAGLVLLVVAAAADPLGVGGAAGFGWKQIVRVVVGAAVTAAGLARVRSATR